MKKIIISVLCLLLMASSVFAAGENQMVGNDRDEHGCIGSAGYVWCESKSRCLRTFEESCSPQEPQQIQSQQQVRTIKGLENAIVTVKNNETQAHLEQVLARIQEHRKVIFQKLENLRIEQNEKNVIEASGTEQAKLFGVLPFRKESKFTINENGDVTRNPVWYDNLMKYEVNLK